jgi:hypothetical protein
VLRADRGEGIRLCSACKRAGGIEAPVVETQGRFAKASFLALEQDD